MTAFLFDCFTWNNAKNKVNDLIISILFICLSFDWQKKTSRHLNFGETFMFVGVAVRKKFLKQ